MGSRMTSCCQSQCGAMALHLVTWETLDGHRTVGLLCHTHLGALDAAGVTYAATAFDGDPDALIDVLLGDVLPE